MYDDINYGGGIYVVMEGEKINIHDKGWNDRASSAKLLNYVCLVLLHRKLSNQELYINYQSPVKNIHAKIKSVLSKDTRQI